MKYAILAIAILTATPAFAKDVTITLNDEEQKVFIALLDAALKNGGLNSLSAVVKFVDKYQKATAPAAAEALPPLPTKKPAAPGQ